jgi:hypothetical protein
MKPIILSAFSILALASTCLADPNSLPILPNHTDEKSMYYGMVTSTGTCVTSIAFSRDPGKAAAIGVPILIGGNLLAAKLFHKHPRLAGLIQIGSGFGCLAGAVAVHAPAPSSFTSTQGGSGSTNGGSTAPSGGGLTGGGSTGGSNGGSIGSGSTGSSNGGSTGSGSTGGSGGGGSNGSGSTGSHSGGSSGSGSTAGSNGGSTGSGSTGGSNSGSTGSGSSGGSNGGSTGGSNGGGHYCITGGGHDCGFPGNGGFNSGNGVGTIPPGWNKNKP